LNLRFEDEVQEGQKGRQLREKPANLAEVKTLKGSRFVGGGLVPAPAKR
jgi:hypothetical protein